MTIRVVIVDDHALVREGIRHLLEDAGPVSVIGEASDGREAVELAHRLAPDVVLMDVGLSGLNGIEATRQITAAAGCPRVIALTMHAEPERVVEMLRAGASGYVVKSSDGAELLAAVKAVAAGGSYVSASLMGRLVDGCVLHPAASPHGPWGELSPREREVLQLVAEGRSVKEIADRLSLSVNTVHTHRRNLMEKIGLHSVAELTRYAIREGLSDL